MYHRYPATGIRIVQNSAPVDRNTHHSRPSRGCTSPRRQATNQQRHSDQARSPRPQCKTELVPIVRHAAFVVQLVGVLPGECDLEDTVLGGDGGGVVPLEVARLPMVEVASFPEGIVAGVEGSPVVVEFVREDQLGFRSVVEGGPRHRPI